MSRARATLAANARSRKEYDIDIALLHSKQT
jgi:hypothetical protein